jgi:hypothetical protein
MKIILLLLSLLVILSFSNCLENKANNNSSNIVDTMGAENKINNQKHQQEINNLDSLTTEYPHKFD